MRNRRRGIPEGGQRRGRLAVFQTPSVPCRCDARNGYTSLSRELLNSQRIFPCVTALPSLPCAVAVERCFPATQIFDTSNSKLGCEIKCRPYNFFIKLENPQFPCDQDLQTLTTGNISQVTGNYVPIYSTTGKLTVVGNSFNLGGFPVCKLNKKYGFGESDLFSYTYCYQASGGGQVP